jgi:tRNA threonylcarbamoyladenosine biosynthesis protein TsaE
MDKTLGDGFIVRQPPLGRWWRQFSAALMLALCGGALQAHPHMWIDAKIDLQFDAQGQLVAVSQDWMFDEMFSSYAKQGLPQTADGVPPQAELEKIAQDWMSALADPMSHYFTTLTQAGNVLPVGQPRGVKAIWQSESDRLSLRFELPLLQPVSATQLPVTVSVADPTYFVAYSFEEPNSVTAQTAPSSCQVQYKRPDRLDDKTAARLAAIPPSGTLPPDLLIATQALQHRVELSCQ